ncbi:hypothetical protein NQZ68_037141 [Dissostichus eleginoides]|nr:hypothetical protein NQZ68_037141 [Dissostichus eleginoides]
MRGDYSHTPVTFQRPGALQKARWMAKLLYTLKMALVEQHIGVKLISDFVAAARSQEHLQNVLQAVEHDRSKQPNLRHCKCKLDQD